LRQDLDENQELYGKRLETKDIVRGTVAPTPAASDLLKQLNRYSRHEQG
jgi:lipid-binding SYLF domain-containing protein